MRLKDLFPDLSTWRDRDIATVLGIVGLVGFVFGFFTVYMPFWLLAVNIDAKPSSRKLIAIGSFVVPVLLITAWSISCFLVYPQIAGTIISASLYGFAVGMIFGGAFEWGRPH